jgi:hypothetical protein
LIIRPKREYFSGNQMDNEQQKDQNQDGETIIRIILYRWVRRDVGRRQ